MEEVWAVALEAVLAAALAAALEDELEAVWVDACKASEVS